jgi:hypothetical protein
MNTERRSITRPDGRDIDFLVAGPPASTASWTTFPT